jgi:hypothetical protein
MATASTSNTGFVARSAVITDAIREGWAKNQGTGCATTVIRGLRGAARSHGEQRWLRFSKGSAFIHIFDLVHTHVP